MTTNKLGLYYTNNNIPKIIDYTLQNLAEYSNLVDIKTCSWSPIPNNPFPNIFAMTTSRNHLNIVVQILQLLYSVSRDQYKYVLFLEHDVIYPKEYFVFPDFDDGCLMNLNYIGLCELGFQSLRAVHRPLHQTIMLYDDCVQYFEKLAIKAIKHNIVIIEPADSQHTWECPVPPIHINHGKNFTTHFEIYKRQCSTLNKHWGIYHNIWQKLK